MKLTVVIVNWNTKELLKTCLSSVLENGSEAVGKVIVVDNDSSDGSPEMVSREFPAIHLIKNAQNLGFSHGCNQGIKESKTDYVAILNSDTVIFPKALGLLAGFMDKNEKTGALGPKLLNEDGSVQLSCRNFPSFKEATVHAFWGIFNQANPFTRSYRQADWDHSTEREVDWISGACMVLRKKALAEAGLFDEDYFMYLEDVDLCYRLKQAGWKVFFYPGARVTHYSGGSSRKRSSRAIIEHQKSIYHFYKTYYEEAKCWRWLVAAGLIVRATLLLILNLFRQLRG